MMLFQRGTPKSDLYILPTNKTERKRLPKPRRWMIFTRGKSIWHKAWEIKAWDMTGTRNWPALVLCREVVREIQFAATQGRSSYRASLERLMKLPGSTNFLLVVTSEVGPRGRHREISSNLLVITTSTGMKWERTNVVALGLIKPHQIRWQPLDIKILFCFTSMYTDKMPTPPTDTLILKRLVGIQIQETAGQIKQSQADEMAKEHD